MEINKEDFDCLVGRAIWFYRKQNEMTQDQLGRFVGLGRTSMVNIEQGRHCPSAYHLCLMADALGVSVTDFFPKDGIQTWVEN